jgi:hypothetical protein
MPSIPRGNSRFWATYKFPLHIQASGTGGSVLGNCPFGVIAPVDLDAFYAQGEMVRISFLRLVVHFDDAESSDDGMYFGKANPI